jgi:hypothetical protein
VAKDHRTVLNTRAPVVQAVEQAASEAGKQAASAHAREAELKIQLADAKAKAAVVKKELAAAKVCTQPTLQFRASILLCVVGQRMEQRLHWRVYRMHVVLF